MSQYAKWQKNCQDIVLSKSQADVDAEGELRRCLENRFIFDDASVRKQFVRKVYLILMAQLLITLVILTLFMLNEPLQMLIITNPIIIWISLPLLIITMMLMMCYEEIRRTYPINFIFLTVFTVIESIVLGVIVVHYQTVDILMAVAITSVACFALSIYATQTRYDFTTCGGILLVIIISFLIFSLVTIFFPSYTMLMIHSCLGAIVFGMYLIFDTQLMLGGNHKYSLNPEEYIFAVLNLYLDIINFFIHILPLVASKG